MSRPTAPFYDVDDPPFEKPYYVTAGLGMTTGFVRGHEVGQDVPTWIPESQRPLCAECDAETFFPLVGDYVNTELAKRICHRCPIEAVCLEHNLFERYGIWGGTSEKDRRMIRKRRNPRRKMGRPAKVA